MPSIEYLTFDQADPKDLMEVVNEDTLRAHLVDHPYFDANSIRQWVKDKIALDKLPGCRVRLVSIDGTLAGWCGIQPDDNGVEIAIVISQRFWGAGIPIFKTLLDWAGELGHKAVLFHLLDTRREYRALAKMASNVRRTRLLGRCFTTYQFSVG